MIKTIISELDSVNASEPHTMPANVNDSEHETVVANVNTSKPETLPANVNASEPKTVASIVQELLSMNYDFDAFEDNVTVSMNEQPIFNEQLRDAMNKQASFNGSERDKDENYEPVETLVEDKQPYKTMDEDEDDSGSDEDDSEYIFYEENNVKQVNVDMNDYYFNIDADVEWDDRIEKTRRKNPKEIQKANESVVNIVHKHFFYVGFKLATPAKVKERVKLHSIETIRKLQLVKNDKVKIRAKCLGTIHVFTFIGERPSITEVVAPNKKAAKEKGKKRVGPSVTIRPSKKAISIGGRGRPKLLTYV
ncbi:hypothetical protein Tco_0639029 [Tanacetum coccineum]